jgi:hypothetical protein
MAFTARGALVGTGSCEIDAAGGIAATCEAAETAAGTVDATASA